MILVDPLGPRAAPWRGGVGCVLISDESVTELLDFAKLIRLRLSWYRHRRFNEVPYFELTPRWRKRALDAGARAVTRRELSEAMRRWKARNLN